MNVDGPEASSGPAVLVTAGTVPPVASNSKALEEEDTTPDIDDSLSVSRLGGLRGRFSSWRRKRKSIPAIAVEDKDDDVENIADGEEINVSSSSSAAAAAAAAAAVKPVVSNDARAETASAAVQANPIISSSRSDTGAKPLEEKIGLGPPAEDVLVTDGQVAAGGTLAPVAESVASGGAKASSKETASLAPVGALVVSEDRGAAQDAVVPAVERTLGVAGFARDTMVTSVGAEKAPATTVTVADPSDDLDLDRGASGDDEPRAGETAVAGEQGQPQGAPSFAGSSFPGGRPSVSEKRAQTNAKRADDTSAGGDAGDDKSREQSSRPSAGLVAAAKAPSEGVASAAALRVDTDNDGKDALLGGPAVGAPTKNERPSSAGNPGNDAKEAVGTSTVSIGPGSTAGEQAAAEAAQESGGRSDPVVSSASSASPVSAGTTLSPRSPSRNEASRSSEGRGTSAEKNKIETPTKTEEREGLDEAGPTVSVEKPTVLPSKAANEEMAAAAGEPAPRAARTAGGVGGGSGAVEGPSSAWNAMNPAADFLKDWVDKAVPLKKAELKRKESAVCWERQWCVTLGAVGTAVVVSCSFWSGTHGLSAHAFSLLPFIKSLAVRCPYNPRRDLSRYPVAIISELVQQQPQQQRYFQVSNLESTLVNEEFQQFLLARREVDGDRSCDGFVVVYPAPVTFSASGTF